MDDLQTSSIAEHDTWEHDDGNRHSDADGREEAFPCDPQHSERVEEPSPGESVRQLSIRISA